MMKLINACHPKRVCHSEGVCHQERVCVIQNEVMNLLCARDYGK